jgi:hypothetical protein
MLPPATRAIIAGGYELHVQIVLLCGVCGWAAAVVLVDRQKATVGKNPVPLPRESPGLSDLFQTETAHVDLL